MPDLFDELTVEIRLRITAELREISQFQVGFDIVVHEMYYPVDNVFRIFLWAELPAVNMDKKK